MLAVYETSYVTIYTTVKKNLWKNKNSPNKPNFLLETVSAEVYLIEDCLLEVPPCPWCLIKTAHSLSRCFLQHATEQLEKVRLRLKLPLLHQSPTLTNKLNKSDTYISPLAHNLHKSFPSKTVFLTQKSAN